MLHRTRPVTSVRCIARRHVSRPFECYRWRATASLRALTALAPDASGQLTGLATPQRPVQLREVPESDFADRTRPVSLTGLRQRPITLCQCNCESASRPVAPEGQRPVATALLPFT